MFNFEKERINLGEAVETIRSTKEGAEWLVNNMEDCEIRRVLIRAWDNAMEKMKETK